MAISEDQARDYPPRLYAEGASNLENKKINHNVHLGDFPQVRDAIGHDVWEHMKQFPLGVVAKLADSQFVWSGKTVHYLLCRQLRVHKKEIWSLVVDQPLRFSLIEFGVLTGLNTGPLPTESFEPEQYKTFWEELNVPLGVGPKLDELRPALEVCRGWSFEKRKWLGLLLLQAMGLYGLHHNSRIPFESAKRVFDDEALRTYPWGRTAFEVLVGSIKMLNPQGKSYTVSGMKDVLLVWAYEAVTCFGERFGRVVNENEIPLLRWGGTRTRKSLTTAISEEIRDHGEVRVKKMVMKEAVEELFPQWSSEENDPQLVNLITDIHADRFVRGFWDVKSNENKKKMKAAVSLDSEQPPAKKQKKAKKNQEVSNSEIVLQHGSEEDMGKETDLTTVVNILGNLVRRFDNFDNFASRIESVESQLTAYNTKFGEMSDLKKMIGDTVRAAVEERVASIENDRMQMRERLKALEARNSSQKDDNVSKVNNIPQKSVNSPKVRYS